MPLLDSCVNSVFEPGNIGSSPGEPPTTVRPGTLYNPDNYPADQVEWSMNYSRFYCSAYLGAI